MALGYASDETHEQLEQAVVDLEEWHHFQAGYTTGPDELQLLDNLAFLISELRDDLASIDHLAPRLTTAVGLMERITRGRARADYSPHAILNDLALAVACTLADKAEERAIPERTAGVRAWQEELHAEFQARRATLPADVRADLETAFTQFNAALHQLERAEGLRDALADLLASSTLLEALIAWRAQALEALTRQHTRWPHLPLIGPRLELALGSDDPQPQVQALFTELGLWWGQHRYALMLPAAAVADLFPQVEEALAFSLAEEIPDWEEAQQVWDDLDDAFARAREAAVPVEHLRGTQAGNYLELIQSLLNHTLPIFAVPALFTQEEPPAQWLPLVEKILQHTRSGELEPLFEAREALWTLLPPPDPDSLGQHWTCAVCGHANALGSGPCANCGSRASA